MAPHNAVVIAVNAGHPDLELARSAAASLRQPHKTPKQIVEDLLDRLSKIKLRRELRGLNHWEEFAPTYLQRMLVRHEVLRQRAVEEFFRTERTKAIARAESKLGDRSEAEDAVAEAFLKLLSGKTGPGHFNRVLRLVCVDRIRARMSAAKVFSRQRDLLAHDEDGGAYEAACTRLADGDPLDFLIREEEIREGIQEIKTDWRHRQTREYQWWGELISHHCLETNVGNSPAQTNM